MPKHLGEFHHAPYWERMRKTLGLPETPTHTATMQGTRFDWQCWRVGRYLLMGGHGEIKFWQRYRPREWKLTRNN